MAEEDRTSWAGVRRLDLVRQVPHVDRPGQARTLQKVRFPDDGNGLLATDRRMFLHIDDLRKLLEIAESSLTQRVVFHGVGLEIEQRQVGDHVMEVWALVGVPAPEGSLRDQTMSPQAVKARADQ